MSMFSDFLHPGRAYQDAQQQMQEGMGRARGAQQPFVTAGQDVIPQLQGALGGLLDPQALQAQWMQGYDESPYAKDAQARAQQSGMDAASAMGLEGSSAAMENIQRGAGSIQQQDRQQYLDDLMQKYMGGVQGLQGMFGTGAGAAGQLGQQELQGGNIMGGLAGGQRQAGANLMGQGIGFLGSILGGQFGL